MDSWFFLSFPRCIDSAIARLKQAKCLAGEVLRLIQDRLSDAEFGKKLAKLSNPFAASAGRGFKFHKRRKLLIRVHNNTLSVVVVCVCNPDGSPLGIHG